MLRILMISGFALVATLAAVRMYRRAGRGESKDT